MEDKKEEIKKTIQKAEETYHMWKENYRLSDRVILGRLLLHHIIAALFSAN